MRKTTYLSSLVLAVALIALSSVVVHAGGGAGAGVPTTLLDCYLYPGSDSPYTLTVTDQFGTRDVALGRARFVCTATSEVTVLKGPELNPDFDANLADHLKCYDGFVVREQAVGVPVTLTDPFSNETKTPTFLRMVCAPAIKTIDGITSAE
jgi:hypothetical protein